MDRNSEHYQYQALGEMASMISFLPERKCSTVIVKDTFPDNECFACFDPDVNHIDTFKTLESLRIRYSEQPLREYKYGIWHDNGLIQGVVIYQEVERCGVRGVSLLDICGRDLGVLLRHWGCTIRHRGFRFVHTLATPQSGLHTHLNEQFHTIKLPLIPTPYYLTIPPLIKNLSSSFTNLTSWDFTRDDAF